jgi:hypothetical protein
MEDDALRTKLTRYISPWIAARPKQYEPRIGTPGLGFVLSLDDLQLHALISLRERITIGEMHSRRINRDNRRIYAAHCKAG